MVWRSVIYRRSVATVIANDCFLYVAHYLSFSPIEPETYIASIVIPPADTDRYFRNACPVPSCDASPVSPVPQLQSKKHQDQQRAWDADAEARQQRQIVAEQNRKNMELSGQSEKEGGGAQWSPRRPQRKGETFFRGGGGVYRWWSVDTES